MKGKRRFETEMYPALALLIVRRAISASPEEYQEALKMVLAGPQSGQDYYGQKSRDIISETAK